MIFRQNEICKPSSSSDQSLLLFFIYHSVPVYLIFFIQINHFFCRFSLCCSSLLFFPEPWIIDNCIIRDEKNSFFVIFGISTEMEKIEIISWVKTLIEIQNQNFSPLCSLNICNSVLSILRKNKLGYVGQIKVKDKINFV